MANKELEQFALGLISGISKGREGTRGIQQKLLESQLTRRGELQDFETKERFKQNLERQERDRLLNQYGDSGMYRPEIPGMKYIDPEKEKLEKEKLRRESYEASPEGQEELLERKYREKRGLVSAEQAEKGLASESGGKLAMLQQAREDIKSVRDSLFKDGKFLRGLAGVSNIPGGRIPILGRVIPDVGFGTKARDISSKVNNALEAKLRIETGAAATQEEFNRLQQRFGITMFDTAESAKSKLDRLEEFLSNAIVTIDPTGRFTYKTGDRSLDSELNADAEVNRFLDSLEAD